MRSVSCVPIPNGSSISNYRSRKKGQQQQQQKWHLIPVETSRTFDGMKIGKICVIEMEAYGMA